MTWYSLNIHIQNVMMKNVVIKFNGNKEIVTVTGFILESVTDSFQYISSKIKDRSK